MSGCDHEDGVIGILEICSFESCEAVALDEVFGKSSATTESDDL